MTPEPPDERRCQRANGGRVDFLVSSCDVTQCSGRLVTSHQRQPIESSLQFGKPLVSAHTTVNADCFITNL